MYCAVGCAVGSAVVSAVVSSGVVRGGPVDGGGAPGVLGAKDMFPPLCCALTPAKWEGRRGGGKGGGKGEGKGGWGGEARIEMESIVINRTPS
jgi:hypothetical protein